MQLRKSTEKIMMSSTSQAELDVINKKLDKLLTMLQKQNKVSTGGCATTDDINNTKKGE